MGADRTHQQRRRDVRLPDGGGQALGGDRLGGQPDGQGYDDVIDAGQGLRQPVAERGADAGRVVQHRLRALRQDGVDHRLGGHGRIGVADGVQHHGVGRQRVELIEPGVLHVPDRAAEFERRQERLIGDVSLGARDQDQGGERARRRRLEKQALAPIGLVQMPGRAGRVAAGLGDPGQGLVGHGDQGVVDVPAILAGQDGAAVMLGGVQHADGEIERAQARMGVAWAAELKGELELPLAVVRPIQRRVGVTQRQMRLDVQRFERRGQFQRHQIRVAGLQGVHDRLAGLDRRAQRGRQGRRLLGGDDRLGGAIGLQQRAGEIDARTCGARRAGACGAQGLDPGCRRPRLAAGSAGRAGMRRASLSHPALSRTTSNPQRDGNPGGGACKTGAKPECTLGRIIFVRNP